MCNVKSLLLGALATVVPAIARAFTVPLFNAHANTNMAVYWGQGPNQQRLAHFCADTTIDIIPIGFVNQFPDQTDGYPGTNFGNQCAATYYKNTDGSTSQLLNSCPNIGPDIKTCQAMGKKILLSLGGAIPNDQHIKSSASATAFATFLWRAFGPDKEGADSTFPRPFGDAAVDGFDFDIENSLAPKENSQDLYYGYSTMISTLRDFYAKEPNPHYISGAPQCVVPDAHLANAIQYSHFDFLFVQFYNTPQCSARAYFNHTDGANGGAATNISFDAWVSFVQKYSNNKGIRLFLGLPASTQVVTDSKMYLQPAEAQELIEAFQCKYPTVFGGVMLYEATASETNSINGKPYADVLKGYLTSNNCVSCTDPLPPATTTVPKELRRRDDASCSKASCFSTLANTADVPDPTEFCDFNQLIPGGIPFPNGYGQDCSTDDVNSACSCLTAGPTSSSTSSSSSKTSSKTSSSSKVSSTITPSITSTSASSSLSSYKRPSGSPIVSSNSTSHSAASGTAPVSRSTGTAPHSKSTGTAPYSKSTGTAPYSRSTGTAPYSRSTGSAPHTKSSGTAPARSGAVSSSGTAPGSTLSGTAPTFPASGSGSLAPSRSSKIPYPLTNSSAPATSNQTPSASGTDIVTTETITSYTTVCPFTSTITSGGSQVITTGFTTSTVFSTRVITICTKCTAKPTPPPTQSGQNSPAVSSSNGVSSASTQEIVTTVIIYTTTTTCPVTQTLTSGGITVTQTTQSVSTVTSTITSTICTKCVPPASTTPVSPSQLPAQTASAGGNGANSPQQPTTIPSNAGSSTPGTSNSPAPAQSSPAQGSKSPPVPSSSPGQASSNANGLAVGTSAPINVPANSPASAGASSGSVVPVIETLTIVPEALTVTQTNQLAQATQGSQAGSSSLHPATNGTLPAGSAGTAVGAAASAGSASPTVVPGSNASQSSPAAFKGAASRMSGGVAFTMLAALAAPFMLL